LNDGRVLMNDGSGRPRNRLVVSDGRMLLNDGSALMNDGSGRRRNPLVVIDFDGSASAYIRVLVVSWSASAYIASLNVAGFSVSAGEFLNNLERVSVDTMVVDSINMNGIAPVGSLVNGDTLAMRYDGSRVINCLLIVKLRNIDIHNMARFLVNINIFVDDFLNLVRNFFDNLNFSVYVLLLDNSLGDDSLDLLLDDMLDLNLSVVFNIDMNNFLDDLLNWYINIHNHFVRHLNNFLDDSLNLNFTINVFDVLNLDFTDMLDWFLDFNNHLNFLDGNSDLLSLLFIAPLSDLDLRCLYLV